MSKANENILELISMIRNFKEDAIRNSCVHPKWQYPVTDIEKEMNELRCQTGDCDKCKEIYLDGFVDLLKAEYLINDKKEGE